MIKVVCAAHTPLIDRMQPDAAVVEAVHSAIARTADEVCAYDPELVVVFGPDHFAGFFYDLMPAFCIGVRADAIGDFGIATPGMHYQVPEPVALAMAEALQQDGLDPAISYRMHTDHGFAQSLEQLAGGVGRYPTIPVFINCAAPPLPSIARVRQFGAAIGRFLSRLDQRVLIVGSGGLSHDPPIPDIRTAPPAIQEALIDGRALLEQRMEAKILRNLDVAAGLVDGTGRARPLNPTWDRWFVDRLLSSDLDALQALGNDDITRDAGVGGHEVRTWVAAFAALAATGGVQGELREYQAVPHWNAGFGIVTAGNTGNTGNSG